MDVLIQMEMDFLILMEVGLLLAEQMLSLQMPQCGQIQMVMVSLTKVEMMIAQLNQEALQWIEAVALIQMAMVTLMLILIGHSQMVPMYSTLMLPNGMIPIQMDMVTNRQETLQMTVQIYGEIRGGIIPLDV